MYNSEITLESKSPANSRRATAAIAYIGLYIALCVVIGFLLAPIPNVELITLLIFLGGYLFGMIYGVLIGGTAIFIFSALNPWGSGLAFPPLIIAQIISYSITGFCGGVMSRLLPKPTRRIEVISIFGLSGGLLTLLFHVLVILFTSELSGFSPEQLGVLLTGGILFALLNIGTNALFFAVLAPILIRTVERFPFVREFNPKNSR